MSMGENEWMWVCVDDITGWESWTSSPMFVKNLKGITGLMLHKLPFQ